MTSTEDVLNFKNQIGEKLEAKFPSFEAEWNKIVKDIGSGFVGSMKKTFQDDLQLFKEIFQFRFPIVIDNNFIFGQIKVIVEIPASCRFKIETIFISENLVFFIASFIRLKLEFYFYTLILVGRTSGKLTYEVRHYNNY